VRVKSNISPSLCVGVFRFPGLCGLFHDCAGLSARENARGVAFNLLALRLGERSHGRGCSADCSIKSTLALLPSISRDRLLSPCDFC
jgi:hypothetical protein